MKNVAVSDGAGSESRPFVSVVVETSTWNAAGNITLDDTLRALAGQTYPPDRREVLVVLPPDRWERGAALVGSQPGAIAIRAPAGLSYYQLRRAGFDRARGEIVAFVDADNRVSPAWIEELVGPLARDPAVGAVMGRTRFRRACLSRMWDVLWWARAWESEGPIDRLYGANNLALRRGPIAASFFDDGSAYRGGWERVMTRMLRAAGATIWLNPRALMVHDYAPRRSFHMAVDRGYVLVAIRLDHPAGLESRLARVPWLAPWLIFPGLIVKDVRRILSRGPRAGLGRLELWKLPFYVLACLALDLVVLAGMVRAAAGGSPPLRS